MSTPSISAMQCGERTFARYLLAWNNSSSLSSVIRKAFGSLNWKASASSALVDGRVNAAGAGSAWGVSQLESRPINPTVKQACQEREARGVCMTGCYGTGTFFRTSSLGICGDHAARGLQGYPIQEDRRMAGLTRSPLRGCLIAVLALCAGTVGASAQGDAKAIQQLRLAFRPKQETVETLPRKRAALDAISGYDSPRLVQVLLQAYGVLEREAGPLEARRQELQKREELEDCTFRPKVSGRARALCWPQLPPARRSLPRLAPQNGSSSLRRARLRPRASLQGHPWDRVARSR